VATPEDAFRCFMATDLDALVLENHLLLKAEQPAELQENAEAYRARYALD
jgi:carbamoyltransferase